ncbi:MAG: tetratricopeptide repeat protein, partial [Pyrinomonadaceae bacterium]
MKNFVFCFLFFTLISAANLFAQNFQETHRKVLTAIENRDYQTADGELQTLQKSDKKTFEQNNFDYLLARLLEKRGDFALAAANYQSVANRNSILKEYALFHLAEIARSNGNLMLERIYLQEISAIAPNSLLTDAAKARIARSYFESKNFETAINLLSGQWSVVGGQTETKDQRPKTKDQSNNRLIRENLVLLGESYLQTGKQTEARDVFNRLINDLPNASQPDDFALSAVKGLDLIDGGRENFGKTAPELAENEHLKRADIYQFNRDFSDARLHYEAIVQNYPTSRTLPNVYYQIGRGLARENNFVKAIDWFERGVSEFPDSTVAEDALSQAASAYSRIGKPKEAVSRYQKIIEKYADAERLDRAYLNIVDVLRDAGEITDALNWTKKTQEVFRGKLPEAVALFSQARIRLAQNDWQNALADLEKLLTFSDLGGTRVPGGTNKAEITFLRAYTLEQLNRFPEAIDTYLLISDGRNEYYGWRATEKLRDLAKNEKSKTAVESKINFLLANIETRNAEAQRQAAQSVLRLTENADRRRQMLEIVKKSYASLPDYQKLPQFNLLEFGRKEILKTERQTPLKNSHKNLADELLFLGLYNEATPELEKSFDETGDQKSKTEDQSFTLAVLYKRGDMAHRAIGFAEPLWKKVPADYEIELIPHSQLELLYPAPYTDALLRFAPERSVDPRFALSIMRQESRFRA